MLSVWRETVSQAGQLAGFRELLPGTYWVRLVWDDGHEDVHSGVEVEADKKTELWVAH